MKRRIYLENFKQSSHSPICNNGLTLQGMMINHPHNWKKYENERELVKMQVKE